MEIINYIRICVEISSNKRDEKETFTLGENDEDESMIELLERLTIWFSEQDL